MPRHGLSGSKIELGSHCTHWAHRDVFPTLPDSQPHAATAIGTTVHAAASHKLATRTEPDLDALIEEHQGEHDFDPTEVTWRFEQLSDFIDRLPPDTLGEVGYAYFPHEDRAERLPDGEGRNYAALPDDSIPMRLDALVLQPDADVALGQPAVIVFDWKTGLFCSEAPGNKQLRTGMLAVAAHHELDRDAIEGSIVRLLPQSMRHTVDRPTPLDLAKHRRLLVRLLEQVNGAEVPPAVNGAHCRTLYCPALGLCPATKGALAAVARGSEAVRRRLPLVTEPERIQGPEHARALYLTIRAAEVAVKAVKSALSKWSDQNGGIPLENGALWCKVETITERVDTAAPGLEDALRELLGDAASRAVELRVSKESIGRAAAVIAQRLKRKKTHVEGEVLEQLRARKLLKKTKQTTYKELASARELPEGSPAHG